MNKKARTRKKVDGIRFVKFENVFVVTGLEFAKGMNDEGRRCSCRDGCEAVPLKRKERGRAVKRKEGKNNNRKFEARAKQEDDG